MANINSTTAKVILQQCLSARLQVKPASGDSPPVFVEINRGLVVYVCFMNHASPGTVEKMARSILHAKLSKTENRESVSILDLPGDVLVVPQSTLSGKMKGTVMQYHSKFGKAEAHKLYLRFVDEVREMVAGHAKITGCHSQVKCGTYGNKAEVMNVVTDERGPFMHLMEF